jgi:anti-sigma factor RsiW
MNCNELKNLFPDYLTGELDQEIKENVEAHLAECESCRLETGRIASTWSALGELPDEEPSSASTARFYDMLEDEKRRLATTKTSRWRKLLKGLLAPSRPRFAFQFGPAFVFLIAGLWIGSHWQSGQRRNGEMAQLRSEIHEMQQTVSLSLLKQSSSSERLQGVNISTQITEPSQPLLASLINTLNSDPNVNVRIAAVDALALFSNVPGVVEDLTYSLSQQESPLVQVSLIDLLAAIQEKKAIEALREFIKGQNVNPTVKEHAEDRIKDFA